MHGLVRADRVDRPARVRGVPRAARRARRCGCAPTARARCRGCRRGSARAAGSPGIGGAAARPRRRRSRGRGRRSPTTAWRGRLVAALKFRSALPVAGLMAAHVAANLPGDLRAPRVLVPVPAQPARRRRARVRPRRRAVRARWRRGSSCRSARASCGATARAGRSAPRGRCGAATAGWRSSFAGHRRPPRCSSTTSTRPARRSTPAPARSAPAAARRWSRSPTRGRCDALGHLAPCRRLAPVPPSRACGAVSRLWRRLAAAVPAIAILYRQSR